MLLEHGKAIRFTDGVKLIYLLTQHPYQCREVYSLLLLIEWGMQRQKISPGRAFQGRIVCLGLRRRSNPLLMTTEGYDLAEINLSLTPRSAFFW